MVGLGFWAVRKNIVEAGEKGKELADAIANLFEDEILDFKVRNEKIDKVHLALLPWLPSTEFAS